MSSLVLACLALAACPANEGDDEVGMDESSTDAGESDSSTDAGESSTDAGESSTDASESSTDAGESSTGDASEVELACMAACEVVAACGADFPGCVPDCVMYIDQLDAECADAELALASCIAGLTCDEFEQYMESSPEPYPCQDEEAATCQENFCSSSTESGIEPGECVSTFECADAIDRQVVCDGSSCTCIEDGQEIGGCADAAAFCDSFDTTSAANACCGWSLL
jgi:hypothetical protein